MSGKRFLTYDEQISFLSEQKQLLIEDQKYAKQILFKIGYFALINGYKQIFKDLHTNKFKLGVKYILICEQTIKSSLSYHFCAIYGEHQEAYLDPANYLQAGKKIPNIRNVIKKISEQLNEKSNCSYIQHYIKKYQSVPFWILINVLTIGQVSKLYACQKGRVKIQVCKDFGTVRVNEVERMLSIMTKFRNVCAHNDRLFDFRTQDALLDMSIHKRLQIPRKAGRYCFGKEDLFAQVIILKIFLQEEDFALFYTELKQCFGKHPIYETVLYKMGFPENWKKIAVEKYENHKETL